MVLTIGACYGLGFVLFFILNLIKIIIKWNRAPGEVFDNNLIFLNTITIFLPLILMFIVAPISLVKGIIDLKKLNKK